MQRMDQSRSRRRVRPPKERLNVNLMRSVRQPNIAIEHTSAPRRAIHQGSRYLRSCSDLSERDGQVTSIGYNLGFTALSLRPELARIVGECYLTRGDWDSTKRHILATNALQTRSAASAVRWERELRQRLALLTVDQLTLLVEAPAGDRGAVAWLAAMKHSLFVFEFAAEVLRDKLFAHDPVLRASDYERFVEEKSLGHPELARLTPSSAAKIRRVLLRMLVEAGLLGPGPALGTIHRPVLSPEIRRSIMVDDPRWLAGFLVPQAEIVDS